MMFGFENGVFLLQFGSNHKDIEIESGHDKRGSVTKIEKFS
jgi:hypothetical protein